MRFLGRFLTALAVGLTPTAAAWATQAKLDPDTCAQLRLEEIKFRQSGILNDINKGPDWAKANLPPDRLREVEHYIELDEQVQFGCRDAKLSPEAEKASEAAARIEINSDADPTIPLTPPPVDTSPAAGVIDPPKPGTAAVKKPAKKAVQKKPRPADPKAQSLDKPKKPSKSSISEDVAPPPIPMQTEEAPSSVSPPAPASPPAATTASAPSSAFPSIMGGAAPATSDPTLPAFGFGETTVVPHSSP